VFYWALGEFCDPEEWFSLPRWFLLCMVRARTAHLPPRSHRVWKAATSKAGPKQQHDWCLKCVQGGRAHPLAGCGEAALYCPLWGGGTLLPSVGRRHSTALCGEAALYCPLWGGGTLLPSASAAGIQTLHTVRSSWTRRVCLADLGATVPLTHTAVRACAGGAVRRREAAAVTHSLTRMSR
jgi:hypothetical protein